MIRHFFIIVFLFLTSYSFGQIEKQANRLLLKRDFNAFKKFTDSYKTEKDSITISSSIKRDLTEGFQESIFYITKSYTLHKGVKITCNSRINIITQGNLIIYFHLESKEMKGFPETFDTSSDTTYNFRDSQMMNALKLKFRQTFFAPLNEKELFIDTIYYGKKCGIKGVVIPNEQKVIDLWVNNRDTINLCKWLQSTNTEKQVYAVQGFNALLVNGITICAATKQLIKKIIHKNGVINTCYPCDSNLSEIQDICKAFKFG